MNEASTCRAFVIPKLEQANWCKDPHDVIEQKTFTDGRIVVAGRKVKRRPEKRADYLLKYTRDYASSPLASVALFAWSGSDFENALPFLEHS